METQKQKPLSLIKTFINAAITVKQDIKIFIKIILLVLVVIALIYGLLFVIWELLSYFNLLQDNYIYTLRLAWQSIVAAIFFIVSACAQLSLITALLNPQLKLKENLNLSKTLFWPFFILAIILNIFLLLACLPLYIAAFLILIKSYVLGVIALIFGYILILFFSSYLLFSPFILVASRQSNPEAAVSAIRKSMILAEGFLFNIMLKLLVLSLVLFALNYLAIIIPSLVIISSILSLVIFIFMILLAFSSLKIMYENYNALKSAN